MSTTSNVNPGDLSNVERDALDYQRLNKRVALDKFNERLEKAIYDLYVQGDILDENIGTVIRMLTKHMEHIRTINIFIPLQIKRMAAARLETCVTCVHFSQERDVCTLCNCSTLQAIWTPRRACPINKWIGADFDSAFINLREYEPLNPLTGEKLKNDTFLPVVKEMLEYSDARVVFENIRSVRNSLTLTESVKTMVAEDLYNRLTERGKRLNAIFENEYKEYLAQEDLEESLENKEVLDAEDEYNKEVDAL